MMATVGALCYGLKHLIAGNSAKQQIGMRARVGFQAFTIVALFAGTYYQQRQSLKKRTDKGFAKVMQEAGEQNAS